MSRVWPHAMEPEISCGMSDGRWPTASQPAGSPAGAGVVGQAPAAAEPPGDEAGDEPLAMAAGRTRPRPGRAQRRPRARRSRVMAASVAEAPEDADGRQTRERGGGAEARGPASR